MAQQTDFQWSVLTISRLPDEPVQNFEMFTRAWDECEELQSQTKDEWIGRSLLSLQGLVRYEIGVLDNSGRVLGGIVLAQDPWDAHVGPCMSVFAQYVLPEFRNRGISPRLMREAIRVARKDGAQTLAFTHRKGPWRYETLYRRIK